MTRVEAPSRLHFGLLSLPVEGQTHWPDPDGKPGLPIRSFGGVGLMIDKPGVVVEAEPALEWSAEGVHAERAVAFAKMFVGTLPEKERCCFRIRVESCPPEHIGLGVGTALGLSVAKAIAVELGHSDWDSVELAKRVGRGKRSAVGVHGFQHGGLIVEAGKLSGEEISPLVGRYAFPEEWRILLVQPNDTSRWHGDRERRAFSGTNSGNETNVLCRILLVGLLPALSARDSAAFGAALREFNVRAGCGFAAEQGGAYSSPAAACLVEHLVRMGLRGVGQSSWGPTVFGFVENENEAQAWLRRLNNQITTSQSDCVVANAAGLGVRARSE